MPGSTGAAAAGKPGMQLVGWALFRGGTGAIIKGSGLSITRTALGTYTVAFSQALASDSYLVSVEAAHPDSYGITFAPSSLANTGFTLLTRNSSGGAALDHYTTLVSVWL